MFEGWGFLIAEIWVLLLLALLAGLLAGWFFFSRRSGGGTIGGSSDADLNACRARVASLEVELERAKAVPVEPAPAPAPVLAAKPAPKPKPAKPVTGQKKKPRALKAPRKAGADDLKVIKGIGPKLEKLCNKLGFYHYDQIAAWTKDEIVWVDENLEGFKGRVTRDKWVAQAKKLAKK